MPGVRSFEPDDLPPTGSARPTVSVCIPCRDEAATIGDLVAMIVADLMGDGPEALVDELLVIDDASTDDTARLAAAAGATVVGIDRVHAEHGPGSGKGNVLWASVVVSRGDLVVWCDGDVTSFHPDWIRRLVAPLMADPTVGLVKAAYARPDDAGGGGRTTELVARPLLSLYHPDLVGLHQPLSGEYAARRSVIEQIPFVQGWGVEIAMLIDVAARFGSGTIGQVDLGVRRHRHRSLHDLSVQAAEVMATALSRTPAGKPLEFDDLTLTRLDGSVVGLNLQERPPVADLGAGSSD